MKTVLLVTAILFGLSSYGVEAAAPTPRSPRLGAKIYGDAARGKGVVETWCASCHKMGTSSDDRVPSLVSLATNPARTDGAIRAFLMQPHKPMPPLELSTQQIEDIVAYLHTLRPESGQSR